MTTEQMDDALENGTNVDVFLTASNFTNLDRLVHRGLIAPLASETLLANMAKMYAPFRDYVTYQQQVYAYPREVLANTRTVNTELLRMYGSFLGEVPTTMSEYIEQMRSGTTRPSPSAVTAASPSRICRKRCWNTRWMSW